MKWLELILNIIGAIAMVVIIIDFFVAKRKIPVYIFLFSIIGLIGAIVYSGFSSLKPIEFAKVCLISSGTPFIIWFLCGGPLVAKSRKKQADDAQDGE